MEKDKRGKSSERSDAAMTLTDELARVHKIMTLRQTAVMKKYDLTARQVLVIAVLAERKDELVTQRTIESELGLTNPTVTVLIQNMISKGFIRKERVPWDGRKWRLSLTPKARQIKDDCLREAEIMNAKFYEGISEEERNLLGKVLGRILENLDNI